MSNHSLHSVASEVAPWLVAALLVGRLFLGLFWLTLEAAITPIIAILEIFL